MITPTFDLQTALSAMADYPAVLRRLGVIRIVEVDLAGSGIDPSTVGPVSVSADPSWDYELDDARVHKTPVVVPAFLSPTRFALESDGRVDPAAIDVAEIDTDSAGIRHVDLARQVVNAETANTAAANAVPQELPPVTLPERLSLPSLRNAGLSLFQGDRATDLRNKLRLNRGLLTATDTHTLAEAAHAVLGLVVDVWDDKTKRWHTLNARRGTYKLPGSNPFTLDDLGAVSLAATTHKEDHEMAPIYLHQSLLRWTGWSLVAPPPGEIVITESEGKELEPPTENALPGLDVKFVPTPGTLPPLRFGRGYRFQLRMVDVVGGVDPLVPTSTDFTHAVPAPPKPPVKFLRFEPVISPVVVATAPRTEGESLDTLVLRPLGGLSGVVSSLLSPLLNTAPIRHIAPPKVGELLCEHHGVLDTSSGAPDRTKYQMIAQRDAADLATVGTPDPREPAPTDGPDLRPRYVPGTNLPVTWLPDPISRGAALSGLPGGLVKIDFAPTLSSWPNLKSFRIQVVDGAAKTQWSSTTRVLSIYVPRGETHTVRMSSYVNDADLGVLGQLGWLVDSGATATEIAAARADIVKGQAWQITPYRTMKLVNAVRLPVKDAFLMGVVPVTPASPRTLGSTKSDLAIRTRLHRPSTGQLAFLAKWTDPVDDPNDPAGPTTETRTATPQVAGADGNLVPHLDVAYDLDPVTADQAHFTSTQVFGDTKRHNVIYSLSATTRYMEHFTQRGKVTLSSTPLKLSSLGIVPGTDAVRSLDGKTAFRRDFDYEVRYDLGTMTRLTGGTIPSGTPVEVAIVAPPVSSLSNQFSVDHPSTARPAPPSIGWVVPTFGWNETTQSSGLQRTRSRSGGGLRVFLDRPWYSSGFGEQLAVVLAGAPVAADDEQMRGLVTQLGADPIVGSAKPAQYPTLDQFKLAKSFPGSLTLPELEGRTTNNRVAAAIHDVVWDAERSRWACDIVLPPAKIYQPFVRLALARYQPRSLAGVELSAVAPVEWAQLNPDRVAAIALDATNLTKVTLTVSGRSAGGTAFAESQPNRVSAIVQTAAVSTPTDLDWTTAGPADGQVLTATTAADGTTTWSGVLTLPQSRKSKPFRLVITEHEQYKGGGRLVYSDVIRL